MSKRVLAVLIFGSLGGVACQPPAHSGYISMANREVGEMDISASIGGGSPVYLGAGVQVEPYVTQSLSIPVTINAGWGGGTHERVREEETHAIQAYLTGRAGVRYRLREWVSLGLGVGGGYTRMIHAVKPIGQVEAEGRHEGTLLIDLELAIGHRWGSFGFSLSTRPTWDAVRLNRGVLPFELALAWYPVDDSWALVASGMIGVLIPGESANSMVIGGAGALGVVFHL